MSESPDGPRVYAAFWGRSAETGKLRRYHDRSLRGYDEIVIPDARVMDFAVLRSGQVIYVSQEGAVAAIGPDFKPLWRQAAESPWFRGSPERLKVSADGRWVALPLPRGAKEREIAFYLYEPRFERPSNVTATMDRADDLPAGRSIAGVEKQLQGHGRPAIRCPASTGGKRHCRPR